MKSIGAHSVSKDREHWLPATEHGKSFPHIIIPRFFLFIVGVMNLVTAVIVVGIFIHYWRQHGKGLKAHCEYST